MHAALLNVPVVASSMTNSYSCELAGNVIGTPVNPSSMEAARQTCNHRYNACITDYENSYGGCIAVILTGTVPVYNTVR